MDSPRFWSADEFDQQAQRLYEVGDYDGALELLRRGTTLYPESVELAVSIGYTQMAREEYVWAKHSFDRALVGEPDHVDALVGLGEVCLKLGERARGLACFERVLSLGFGQDLDLMLSVGRALLREGLWEHAERFFRRAVAASAKSADAAADLAHALHRKGDVAGAREWLEAAVRLDPEAHDARSLLANLCYEGGDPEGALANLERIPVDSMWDAVSVWRFIELARAYRPVSGGSRELEPYLERLDQLFVEPTPEERILLEVELEARGLGGSDGPRDQLDLFGEDHGVVGAGPEGSWAGIVRAMCDSAHGPGFSIDEFMRETARRVRDLTGIEIPHDDPEAFLKASARAGVLHIDR